MRRREFLGAMGAMALAEGTQFLAAANTDFDRVVLSGELRKWHVVTFDFQGPESAENAMPNPFLDCRLDVVFMHGDASYVVPGYYAADGNAAETGSEKGDKGGQYILDLRTYVKSNCWDAAWAEIKKLGRAA